VKELLSNVGSGGGGPAQAVAAGGATGAAPAAAAEEEEKKEEEKEESDDDMVCSFLFPCNNFWLTDDSFRALVFSINPLEPCSCTPLRVQMYMYSPCTFRISAISSSRTQSITNDTRHNYLYKIVDRHGPWLTRRSSWTPLQPTYSSICPGNQHYYFQPKLEKENHLRGRHPCRRQ